MGEFEKRVKEKSYVSPPPQRPTDSTRRLIYLDDLFKIFEEAKKELSDVPQQKINKFFEGYDCKGLRIIVVSECRCYPSGAIDTYEEEVVDLTEKFKKWFGNKFGKLKVH